MKSCPTIEEICLWIDGSSPVDVREQLTLHISSCPRCAREADDARSFVENGASPGLAGPRMAGAGSESAGAAILGDEVAVELVRRRSRAGLDRELATVVKRRELRVALVAGLLATSTVFAFWALYEPNGPAADPGFLGQPVYRGSMSISPQSFSIDTKPTDGSSSAIARWSEVEDAVEYHVFVSNGLGEVVYDFRTAERSHRFPDSLDWGDLEFAIRVEALNEAEAVVAVSRESFRIQ